MYLKVVPPRFYIERMKSRYNTDDEIIKMRLQTHPNPLELYLELYGIHEGYILPIKYNKPFTGPFVCHDITYYELSKKDSICLIV